MWTEQFGSNCSRFNSIHKNKILPVVNASSQIEVVPMSTLIRLGWASHPVWNHHCDRSCGGTSFPWPSVAQRLPHSLEHEIFSLTFHNTHHDLHGQEILGVVAECRRQFCLLPIVPGLKIPNVVTRNHGESCPFVERQRDDGCLAAPFQSDR
jgi:hypothetical protein